MSTANGWRDSRWLELVDHMITFYRPQQEGWAPWLFWNWFRLGPEAAGSWAREHLESRKIPIRMRFAVHPGFHPLQKSRLYNIDKFYYISANQVHDSIKVNQYQVEASICPSTSTCKSLPVRSSSTVGSSSPPYSFLSFLRMALKPLPCINCQSEAAIKCLRDLLCNTFVSVITCACLLLNLCKLQVHTFSEAWGRISNVYVSLGYA